MSTQNPRPFRRRIAGERRPVSAGAGASATKAPPTTDAPTTDAPAADATTADRPAGRRPLRWPWKRGGAAREPSSAPDSEPGTDWVDPSQSPASRERDAFGPSGAAGKRAPSWATVTGLGVLALLLVGAVAVLGLGVWDVREVREQDSVDQATRSAPAVAESAAAAILAYDYRTLDADEKAAERYMTTSYRKEYVDTFALVQQNAPKVKATVKAQVKASGVTHADPDRVTVLVYVNQTTTSTANGGEPQVALNRVQLSMVRHGDGWLVDDITSY